MDIQTVQTIKTFLLVFVLSVVVYLFFFKQEEHFKPIVLHPAPTAILTTTPKHTSPQSVSPSGPNPPNMKIPETLAKESNTFTCIPNDPYDEMYSSQNIVDTLRLPERSFGPGIVNNGLKQIVESGVASKHMLNTSQPLQPIS